MLRTHGSGSHEASCQQGQPWSPAASLSCVVVLPPTIAALPKCNWDVTGLPSPAPSVESPGTSQSDFYAWFSPGKRTFIRVGRRLNLQRLTRHCKASQCQRCSRGQLPQLEPLRSRPSVWVAPSYGTSLLGMNPTR